MENELKINGCDYWGTYDGYKVYHNFNKYLPDVDGIVFEMENKLYLNGEYIGKVDRGGKVSDWNPGRATRKRKASSQKVSFVAEQQKVDGMSAANDIIGESWKRSIDDLVGKKLATYEKASS